LSLESVMIEFQKLDLNMKNFG